MTKAQTAENAAPAENGIVDMDDLVALCKRRGFVFRASDIYEGINGFWDYGPLGVLLKNNLRDLWWQDMVIAPPVGPDGKVLDIVGLDSSIIQNPKAWEASGHVAGFSDPMVDCTETKFRYRQDHLVIFVVKDSDNSDEKDKTGQQLLEAGKVGFAFIEGDYDEDRLFKKIERVKKKNPNHAGLVGYKLIQKPFIERVLPTHYQNIVGPDSDSVGTLTEPRAFNLMFKTYIGATATEDDVAYLRPETAQGIFLNYRNVLSSARVKMPFGIAQIGKAFRNEVTPRNFIYRSREFEQMEMEWFCPPDQAKMWFDFWIAQRKAWWKKLGLRDENLLIRPHEQDELSHYAKEGYGTVDVEYRFPFTAPGFGELEGVAHRCAFDLTQHQQHSGTKMEYVDPQAPDDRFIPHVIEPAAGLTRGVLAVLADAYTADPSRPSKMYMKFNPKLAPVKAAVLPLLSKDGLPEIAEKLYMSLRGKFMTELDIKQNIGKRYARQDEIGTPFCLTVDPETHDDQAVTVRHRDTMQQTRIALDKVEAYLAEKLL